MAWISRTYPKSWLMIKYYMTNQEIDEELHKPVIRTFEK